MLTGTVKRLVADRGFGFLKAEGRQPDVFFHVSSLPTPDVFATLEDGQQVQYELDPEHERARARRVVPLG